MTIDGFIKQYNSKKTEEELLEYVQKHIKNTYVPYEEKLNICGRIISNTSYTMVDEKKIYKKNTPAQYVLFVMNIIDKYTDIDIDFNKTLDCYNKLNKNGILNVLIGNVPETEYMEFKTLLEMCNDDEYENNRDLVSWLDVKVDTFKILFDTFGNSFKELTNNEEIKTMIAQAINSK